MAEKEPNFLDSPAYSDLIKTQHKIFCEEWCTGDKSGKPFSDTKAAEVAGYAHPTAYGCQLRARDDIRKACDARLLELSMGKGEILARMTSLARCEVGDLVEINTVTGNFRINVENFEKVRPYISEFGYDSNGNPKFKFHSSYEALRDLARAHGMFKDGLDVNLGGVGGGTLNVNLTFVEPGQTSEQPDSA